MTFETKMTRCPRPIQPQKGEECAALLPDLSGPLRKLIIGATGSSPYLASLCSKESTWISGALQDLDGAVAQEFAQCRACAPDQLADRLRQAKRRIALLTGLADLAGVWSLHQVTGTLSDFADTAVDVAMKAAIAQQIKRGKLPGLTEDDIQTAGGMVALAMGKMGAGELNYSSDIDLICLFDETRFDSSDFAQARMGFIRATRAMSAMLNDVTGEGYVFRTDLRLRPDPSSTPVCLAMETAERYYESLGRTWERAAYIKARAAAGDIGAGEKFLKTLTPFVWRRHLDFAAIQDAHDMRLAIRAHKGLGGPISLPGHNMKLGRGGIREIEFFTQTRQLISGGREVSLRVRGTCEGLQSLAQKNWIKQDLADLLVDHYTYHRTVEHRLQMVRDAQTHSLPNAPEEFERLAALMDVSRADLENDLTRRLSEVHEETEGFFAPERTIERTITGSEVPEQSQDLDLQIMENWHSYPALRSPRAAAVFERIKPGLLARLSNAAKPNEALLALDGFLQGLPAGVQLFSLFEANPQLVDLLIDIVGTSAALAQYLSRNASVFDAVIGGAFFSRWEGQDVLQAALAETLAHENDYEAKLDSARRWNKEFHFRIGVHLLRGLISPFEAGRQYCDLARAVIGALWPEVVQEFSRRHGPPPGRGAVLMGMGSLGAGMLNASSDLDLIVIYDPEAAEMSEGPRSLGVRPYYARLTQAMITALSAPMAQGRLYEVDMRLRPSGNQGPVATSWTSFQDYQRNDAWVWEHLALTRADAIAGAEPLGADISSLKGEIMTRKRDLTPTLEEVAKMRLRIQEAKSNITDLEPKIGAGRMQDIELFAQAGALLAGTDARSTAEGIKACVACGLIDAAEAHILQDSYDLCSALQMASKLISAQALILEDLGEGAIDFLCRTLGFEGMNDLQTALRQKTQASEELIENAINRAGVVLQNKGDTNEV